MPKLPFITETAANGRLVTQTQKTGRSHYVTAEDADARKPQREKPRLAAAAAAAAAANVFRLRFDPPSFRPSPLFALLLWQGLPWGSAGVTPKEENEG